MTIYVLHREHGRQSNMSPWSKNATAQDPEEKIKPFTFVVSVVHASLKKQASKSV